MHKRSSTLTNRVFKRYFLPTILMSMALSLGIIVDGIIVGNKLGSGALAVVNLSTPVVLSFNAIYVLLGVGGSILSAIAMGQRNRDKANAFFIHAVVAMLFLSTGIMIVGLIFHESLAGLIAGDTLLKPLLSSYLKILFIGAPLLIMVPGMACFIRVDGNPRLASLILIVANVANLIFDFIYLYWFKTDVTGAASATLTGYGIGFVILVFYFLNKKSVFQFKQFKGISFVMVKRIASTGLPAMLSTLLLFLKIFLINMIVVNVLGTSGMAVFSVCLSCLAFVSMFISGAAQTISPIISTLYGEGDQQGIKFTIYRTFKIVVLASIAMILLFEFFPENVLLLFGIHTKEEILLGIEAIRIFSVSLLGTAVSVTLIYYYQTIQRKVLSSIIAVVQGFVFVIPLAYFLSKVWGGPGIWISFALGELGTLFFVVLSTLWIRKNSEQKLEGILLYPKPTLPNALLDVTIADDACNASRLSKQVILFCEEQGITKRTAMHVGLAIEELAVNTFQHGYLNRRKRVVDVRVSINSSEIMISLKDDALPFDPTIFSDKNNDNFQSMGLHLIKSIASEIKYTRLLGLNNTIIKIHNN